MIKCLLIEIQIILSILILSVIRGLELAIRRDAKVVLRLTKKLAQALVRYQLSHLLHYLNQGPKIRLVIQSIKRNKCMVPTRSTKALYSNKSEYNQNRQIASSLGSMKPISSTKSINSSSSRVGSKPEYRIQYPVYERLNTNSLNQHNLDHYRVTKTARESHRFIEFRLRDEEDEDCSESHEDELGQQYIYKNDIDASKNYKHKFINPKIDVVSKINSHKSETNIEKLRHKYGRVAHKSKAKKSTLVNDFSPNISASKSGHYDVDKPRCKTSRNAPLPKAKDLKSIKQYVGSIDIAKTKPGILKNTSYKPSQVKIYLKNDDE